MGYMSDKVKTTGLISPDNLPDRILDTLSHTEIQSLGYWLFAQLRSQKEYTARKMKPVNKGSCDHMLIDDFVMSVKEGLFTSDDGHGRYATETEESDITVRLSEIRVGRVRSHEWTHVCWYNK